MPYHRVLETVSMSIISLVLHLYMLSKAENCRRGFARVVLFEFRAERSTLQSHQVSQRTVSTLQW